MLEEVFGTDDKEDDLGMNEENASVRMRKATKSETRVIQKYRLMPIALDPVPVGGSMRFDFDMKEKRPRE